MPEEIFSTKSTSIFQCDLTDSFLLKRADGEIEFKLCDLYTFRKKVVNLDLVELLDSSAPDIEIIHLPHCDRFLALTIYEILEFRELLNGTFNTLALNSTIKQILRKGQYSF